MRLDKCTHTSPTCAGPLLLQLRHFHHSPQASDWLGYKGLLFNLSRFVAIDVLGQPSHTFTCGWHVKKIYQPVMGKEIAYFEKALVSLFKLSLLWCFPPSSLRHFKRRSQWLCRSFPKCPRTVSKLSSGAGPAVRGLPPTSAWTPTGPTAASLRLRPGEYTCLAGQLLRPAGTFFPVLPTPESL